MAGEQHGMCESAFMGRDSVNGEDKTRFHVWRGVGYVLLT
jgi:hypothetical protein